MVFHCLLLLCHRAIGDRLGEAKASGNLGNTLKVLGKYEEAVVCCQRHLDISRELNDRVRFCSGAIIRLVVIGNIESLWRDLSVRLIWVFIAQHYTSFTN